MDNLVQKSMKLDAETERKIKAFSVKSQYWKFNAVVNAFLAVMVDGLDAKDLLEVLRYVRWKSSKRPKITIEWI